MFIQLLKIIIWPKYEVFSPRIIEFELGKVNVITGASRTGKSAIIPIIDYCLASSDCLIPIDTIRDYASWYGVIIKTRNEEILIARRVPDGNKPSRDFYLLRGSKIDVPDKIENENESIDGVKYILDTISSVPFYKADYVDKEISYNARLGFRDLMKLVFQTQGIIANQNILFYKTHAHDHRERLRNWFPFILGAENIEVLRARQQSQEIEKRLSSLKREYEKVTFLSKSWIENINYELKVAKEYGLLTDEILISIDPEDSLQVVDYILEHVPDYSQTNLNNIDDANKETMELEKIEKELSAEIGIYKKRLSDLEHLNYGIVEYEGSS